MLDQRSQANGITTGGANGGGGTSGSGNGGGGSYGGSSSGSKPAAAQGDRGDEDGDALSGLGLGRKSHAPAVSISPPAFICPAIRGCSYKWH